MTQQPKVYDCRKDGKEAGSVSFPCNVRILDPATGQKIPNVFYARTAPAKLGRFVSGPDGQPLARATGRKVPGQRKHAEAIQWEPSGMAPKPLVPVKVKEYERLELWEDGRPWVAVAVDTGEVIAKSEGCP